MVPTRTARDRAPSRRINDPLSTLGTSQEAQPPTPPLTPPLTPPEGTQMKPQVVVGRWLPPYGQEAPL